MTRAQTPWKRTVGLILLGGAVGLAGHFVGRAFRPSGGAEIRPGLGLDALEVAGVTAIAIVGAFGALLAHELGHLLGGRLVGFRALLLIVGPFRLERGASRWHWRLNRSLALAGGLAASAPAATADPASLRRRMSVMIAGGPVTSLLAATLAWVIWRGFNPAPLGPATAFPLVLALFGLLSFGACSAAIGAVTLIPGQTAGYQSDGARLRLLLQGGPRADRDVAMLALFGASMGGTRPRDWPPALLEQARAVEDASYTEVVGWQLAQMHAADSGQRDEARRWLDRVLHHLDRLPPAARPAVRYDAARQLARAGDLEAARALVAEGGVSMGAPFLKPLAELAILVADGSHAAARHLVPQVGNLLADGIDPGGAAWLRSELAELARTAGAEPPTG